MATGSAALRTTQPSVYHLANAARSLAAGFIFNGSRATTTKPLVIYRTLALARAAFKVVVEEKPTGRFMIRNRTRVVKRQPKRSGAMKELQAGRDRRVGLDLNQNDGARYGLLS